MTEGEAKIVLGVRMCDKKKKKNVILNATMLKRMMLQLKP